MTTDPDRLITVHTAGDGFAGATTAWVLAFAWRTFEDALIELEPMRQGQPIARATWRGDDADDQGRQRAADDHQWKGACSEVGEEIRIPSGPTRGIERHRRRGR